MVDGRSKGKAFAVESEYGKGKIVVLGALPEREFLAAMLKYYSDFLSLPAVRMEAGSYLIRRENEKGEFAIAVNLNGKGGRIQYYDQDVLLAPFETRFLEKSLCL